MILVSFVIPLYKPYDKYLDVLIGKLNEQTDCCFEVIFVKYCEDNFDFTSIHNFKYTVLDSDINNYAYKRNIGIKHARGTYVSFIDNDDLIDIHYVENVNKVYKIFQYDYIALNICTDSSLLGKKVNYANIECINNKDVIEINYSRYVNSRLTIHTNLHGSWAKCFKKDIIDKNRVLFHCEPMRGEDEIFNNDFCACCSSAFIMENYYGYFWAPNSNSLMKKIDSPFYFNEPFAKYLLLGVKQYCPDLLEEIMFFIYRVFDQQFSDLINIYLCSSIKNKDIFKFLKNNLAHSENLKKVIKDIRSSTSILRKTIYSFCLHNLYILVPFILFVFKIIKTESKHFAV